MQRKRASRKQARSQAGAGPSSNAITYRGPILTKAELRGEDTEVVTLFLDAPVISTGAGVLVESFTSDPFSSAPQGWSAWAARFTEFRVLSTEVEYIPGVENSISSGNTAPYPFVSIEDRVSAGVPASYAVASGYVSCKYHPINRRFKIRMDMTSTSEAQFGTTGAVQPDPWHIAFYGTGFSFSTGFGRTRQAFVIQFRNRVA